MSDNHDDSWQQLYWKKRHNRLLELLAPDNGEMKAEDSHHAINILMIESRVYRDRIKVLELALENLHYQFAQCTMLLYPQDSQEMGVLGVDYFIAQAESELEAKANG